MQTAITLIRILFVSLATLLAYTYAFENQFSFEFQLLAAAGGFAIGSAIIGFDIMFGRINLRSLNIITVGLFFGYLLGEAIILVSQTAIDMALGAAAPAALPLVRAAVFLTTCYFGMALAARSSDGLYMSIPFVKLKPGCQKKKNILLDASALNDPRTLDLASSGLVDQQLVVPRFFVKSFQEQIDNADENTRTKARRGLDTLKRLEALPSLEMEYLDADCSDVKDPAAKILKLARLNDANILTADMARSLQSSPDGPRIINLNMLSQALKPFSQSGEMLAIKIQRYGKEPRQGVGYLDDGTMVVVNGGAEFIGETIRTHVLSVKHTSSGRMIFCNALEEGMENEPMMHSSSSDGDGMPSNYFLH